MQFNTVLDNKITALVPIRHFSQRVAGKNYRLFAGKPLYHQIINRLLDAKSINTIIIDTDSHIIRDDCIAMFGSQVKILDRPEYLCSPETSMNAILLHDLKLLGHGHYFQTHTTNPLILSNTIDDMVKAYFNGLKHKKCDSLFSVTSRKVRIWDENISPLNHEPSQLIQTQDLRPFYEENSCAYIFSSEILMETKNRIGKQPLMYTMEPLEAVDIDEENDFLMAETLFLMRQKNEIKAT